MRLKQLFCNHIYKDKTKTVRVSFKGYLIDGYSDHVIIDIKALELKFKICEKCGIETYYKTTIIPVIKQKKYKIINGYFVDLNYNRVSDKELLSGKYPMKIIDSKKKIID